ncbi:MAG: hypothetical protein JST30_04040 [Armatimonadetes bacterium]|nr:hypothetical protein [Armatimonadota bacterium]
MKPVFALLALWCAALSSAQSLHFSADGCIPFETIAGTTDGRLLDARVDVLRCKRDWDEYFSAQFGAGGPVFTSLVQPDICREQVIAVNLGNAGTAGVRPVVRSVRSLGGGLWEVVVDATRPEGLSQDVAGIFSPYVAFRTPYGPDDYDVVILDGKKRDTLRLRSEPARRRWDWRDGR